jgi:phytanoyl-CoA hydroxylase
MKPSLEQVAQFATDGYLKVDRIISDQQVERVLVSMKRVYQGEYNFDRRPLGLRKRLAPFGTSSSVQWVLNARVADSQLWEIATDPGLGEAAAALLGTASVSIVEDQLLDKPGQGAPVNVHQDYSYWRFSTSTKMLTCWIALCDVTADMGPIELLPGSHGWGIATRPRNLIHGSNDEYLAAIQGISPPGVPLDLDAAIVPRGGGVFFHSLTFHGSRGNMTNQWRRALSLHWAAEECRLDRSHLLDYDYPYFFSQLKDGDRLVNKYIPQVFPAYMG